MPNTFRLVTQGFQPNFNDRREMIFFLEQKERDLRGVLGVKRKIVRFLFGDICHSQRHGRAFKRWPIDDFRFPVTLVHSCLCEHMTFSASWAQGQLHNGRAFAQKRARLFDGRSTDAPQDPPTKSSTRTMTKKTETAWKPVTMICSV